MENFDTGRTEDGQTILYSAKKACYNIGTAERLGTELDMLPDKASEITQPIDPFWER